MKATNRNCRSRCCGHPSYAVAGKTPKCPRRRRSCETGAGKGTSIVGVDDVSKVTVEEGMEDGEEVVKDPLT